MRISHRLKKVSALGVATLAFSGTIAATPAAAAEVAVQAAPPTCVVGWVNSGTFTQTAYARNDCSSTYRVRITWRFGVDGPCQTMTPGSLQSHRVPKVPRVFDGLALC